MLQDSYRIVLTLLHSIWQLAVLLGSYYAITGLIRSSPMVKRNLLLLLLGAQIILSCATFSIYYLQNSSLIFSTIKFPAIATGGFHLLYPFAPLIFGVYSLIIVARLSFKFYHWQLFKQQVSSSLQRPPVEIKLFTNLKAAHFGIHKKVNLWYSAAVSSPIVYGLLKPVILLPLSMMTRLNMAETEALIIHELTHIKNNDYLLNWFLVVAEQLYFFNPFMHLIAQKIKLEREKSCDIQVIQFDYNKIEYANALLKIARMKKKEAAFQLAAVGGKSALYKRIRFFSGDDNLETTPVRKWFSAIAVVGMFLLCCLATLKILNPGQAVRLNYKDIIPVGKSMFFPKKNKINNFDQEKKASFSTAAPAIVFNSVAAIRALNQTFPAKKKRLNEDRIETMELKVEGPVAVTVALDLSPAPVTRQVVVNEESSNGATITTVYTVKIVDGDWVTEPLWSLSEVKQMKDSVKAVKKPDTLRMVIPPVQ